MARLKKVKIPKNTHTGPVGPLLDAKDVAESFEIIRKAEENVTFVAPPEPSEFAKRMMAAREKVKARIEAAKASYGPPRLPPVPKEDLLSDTIIEGKSVAEWSALVDKRCDVPEKTLDLTDLPGWAVWAVEHWKARGKPTPSTKTLDEITQLREKAEELVKFAALDQDKAKNLSPAKAKKLMEAAQKKSDKAARLFDEANALAKEFKKA